jgi:hypothetical protein
VQIAWQRDPNAKPAEVRASRPPSRESGNAAIDVLLAIIVAACIAFLHGCAGTAPVVKSILDGAQWTCAVVEPVCDAAQLACGFVPGAAPVSSGGEFDAP